MAGITDSYPGQSAASLTAAADDWETLTPHDSTNFTFLPKAIAVGATAGSFVAVSKTGATSTFYAPAGANLQIRPVRINSTGMTGGMTFIGLK
jgi:hypothetical protein